MGVTIDELLVAARPRRGRPPASWWVRTPSARSEQSASGWSGAIAGPGSSAGPCATWRRDQATEGPATLWGLTHVVADIDATADLLGERVGRVKDAVQPGRRIATLRHRELGMSVNTAVITPHV